MHSVKHHKYVMNCADSDLNEVFLVPFWIERVVDDACLNKLRRAEFYIHKSISDIFRVHEL